MGVTQRLLDMLDRAERREKAALAAARMSRLGAVTDSMRDRLSGMCTTEQARALRDAWVSRWPEARRYFDRVALNLPPMHGRHAFGMLSHPTLQAYAERKAQEEVDIAEARKRVWALGLDWQVEVDGAAETGESVVARVGRLWDIENTPSDDLAKLNQIYLSAPPCQHERVLAAINARTREPSWSYVRSLVKFAEFGRPRPMRALGAMSGKTAFLDNHIGLHHLQTDTRVLRAGRPDEVRRQGDDVQVIDYKYPRPTSLSYSTIASFRDQTCPGQFEEKRTPPTQVRHLSGVSVDLLIAVGQIGGA